MHYDGLIAAPGAEVHVRPIDQSSSSFNEDIFLLVQILNTLISSFPHWGGLISPWWWLHWTVNLESSAWGIRSSQSSASLAPIQVRMLGFPFVFESMIQCWVFLSFLNQWFNSSSFKFIFKCSSTVAELTLIINPKLLQPQIPIQITQTLPLVGPKHNHSLPHSLQPNRSPQSPRNFLSTISLMPL